MPRPIFVDTEWTSPPWLPGAELQWIGLADLDGRSWYGISSEVVIDPAANPFVAGAFTLIDPAEPRLTRAQLAQAVVDFCGAVDAFWAWVPTLASFSEYVSAWGQRTGNPCSDPEDAYRRCWDVDLQMLQALVRPWPAGWPVALHDLHRAATEAGVPIPPRAANHLHPRVHAEWNRQLYQQVFRSGS